MRKSKCHQLTPSLATRGFTLVEMAITVLVLGLLFAISVPTVQTLSGTYTLKNNTENIAAQLRMAREKAIGTGMEQPLHFTYNYTDPYGQTSDFHVHYPSGWIPSRWKLSKGITYFWGAGTNSQYTMKKDGRSDTSGMIILQDLRGNRDTVSVQLSGLVLTK